MTVENKLQVAIALIEGRLHTAVGDKRCGCGPCAHWVAVAARRAGVPLEQLEAALPQPARPERPRRQRRRRAGVPLQESCTFRVRGREIDHGEGLALLLKRLHRRE